MTTADVWWKQRRAEILEDFDREVLRPRSAERAEGDVDGVDIARANIAGRDVVGKQLVGHAENGPPTPALNVDIQMTLVTPANAKGPVPVMIMFGGGVLPVGALGGPAPAELRARVAPSAARLRRPRVIRRRPNN